MNLAELNGTLQILADDEREERVNSEYEDLMNEIELLREHEFLNYSADLEDFSPFDTFNS
jgi:hypothetical protein